MTRREFEKLLFEIHTQEGEVLIEGQREYAHDLDNCHANFDRVAALVGITPEQAMLVFILKHIDGICAWAAGHTSQREPVTGRIKDARAYLALLWGMAERGAEEPERWCGDDCHICGEVNALIRGSNGAGEAQEDRNV